MPGIYDDGDTYGTPTTARNALLAELLGDDHHAGHHTDARARLEGLIDDALAEEREHVATEIDAAIEHNLAEYPHISAMRGRRLGLAAAARIVRDRTAGGAR
ncbi:hypothetical protein ACPC54_17850 [Kitasatospora sp. NPDC094028]